MKGYRELAQRMQAVAVAQNPALTDITISKNLIAEENGRAIKTRIPGTWGENAQHVWINKDKAMEIHRGKTILTFLDREKDYKKTYWWLIVAGALVAAVEADSGGETEAGTTQRDLVRMGVVSIPAAFLVSPKWLKVLTGFKQREKLAVDYFDTETLETKRAEMFMEGYKAALGEGYVL